MNKRNCHACLILSSLLMLTGCVPIRSAAPIPQTESVPTAVPTSTPVAAKTPTQKPSPTAAMTDNPTAEPTPEPVPLEKLDDPHIIIEKSERLLSLYDGDILCRQWPVALGWSPMGHKEKEGDGKTPEGEYYICTRNSASAYYLSFGLSYPGKKDAERGLDEGLITQNRYEAIVTAIEQKKCPPWDTPLGGAIMIHGGGSSFDWTAGCIAVENEVMDELWEVIPLGTKVSITP